MANRQKSPELFGSGLFRMLVLCRSLFFLAVAVTAHELVHTTCGVNELLLAGEERVRAAGDFKLHEGVSHAINFDCLLSGDGGTGDEDFIVRHVFEHYFAIVGRMDVFFHFLI